VSDKHIRNIRLDELSKTLKQRGFPKRLIKDGIDKAMSIPRKDLLKVKHKQNSINDIAFVSTFNPCNPELFNNIHNNRFILDSDNVMKEVLKKSKIIKSKRQPPSLKKLLTKANFEQTLEKRVTKCNRPNCSLCQHIIESNHYKFSDKIFYVNQSMTCDVKNVLYVITCNGCNEFYIGQTGDKLRTRRTIHAQQIRDPSTRMIPLSKHLDQCSDANPKFQMFPFFKLKSNNTVERLIKERYFIDKFKPKLNKIITH
jgi:hypothetical protein